MFLKTLRSLRHTLALRLTIWYAGIFAVSSILAFTLVYASVVSVVQERTDEDLGEDIEEFVSFMQLGGLERVKAEMAKEAQGEEASHDFIRLWAPDGRELMATDLSSWTGLGNPLEVLAKVDSGDGPILATLALPRRADKVRVIYGAIAPGLVLEIGESLEEDEELIAALLRGFLIALAAITLLGGPIGWFMARRALRGVQEVTRTATEIADGALDRRVEVRSQGDELDTLARTFNTMVDRIQALVIGMREMTDNLAHDLRSPLGRIRASAETSLTSDGSKAEAEAMAVATTEECDRLLEIINTTLDIAEAESGAAKLKLTDIDLVDLVHDALELFQPIAEDKRITITADLPDHCRLHGDRQRLQRVVANLLDNGLKYMPAGGRVAITLVAEGERVTLAIEDTGIGISPNESARIFERFYRCDRSRSKQGNGLGLSLALAFVRAHGGDITVNSTPGLGSTFSVVLPRSRDGRYFQQGP
ncbi:MAG: sensor histidine kinase [Gammaproteobacteria bacterium]